MNNETQKPRLPIYAHLLSVVYHASLWVYPVASGGVGNVAGFVAWALCIFMATAVTAMLFMPLSQDKYRRSPRWHRATLTASSTLAIVWLAYHGAFAMAGMLAYVLLMSKMLGAMKREKFDD